MLVKLYEEGKVCFRLLATNDFHMESRKMRDLLLRARVVARTSCMKIPRRCLTAYVKNSF